MSECLAFVEEYLRGLYSMTALCSCYGISRRDGYKWLARYLADGVGALGVGLEEVDDGIWAVYFGTYLLGHLNERERRILGAHNRSTPDRHTTT